ncbi:MAG: FAD-dependent oxidoreductase [Verrucomicrobia bacterium]|nr:FAD-dependent oxidoreductase [Verrucomicrobiota bacterium]
MFRETRHQVDFCVVGGGMAGLTAAVSAARRGAKIVLMHDRPVLGGNASSECRVHICGADIHNRNKNMRETGILEELRLENLARNPHANYSIWDTILYEKVMSEPSITLLLNCSCLDAKMNGDTIRSVTGWQLTTQTRHTVEARIFADCSGDGILAPLSGARFRMGREARAEYGESIAPEQADARTMGMTCLFQTREYATPQPFDPPSWVRRFDKCDDLPYGANGHNWWQMGYWWIELGGEHDSIHDTEKLRDELLKITLGVWDHVKNRCPQKDKAANWALDWLQFLPAKRESRRFVGAHVLSQKDVEAGGRFDDLVAYGGWSMDDHHPAGFGSAAIGAPATIFHHAPSPYGIPYRSLYSVNVRNLMFAGRNASCTHAAMSSTRVMGTGCSMGQAVGTAAAMALDRQQMPADVGGLMDELQQELLRDDAYLPGIRQQFKDLVLRSELVASRGNPEPVRDGINRPVGDDPHCWPCKPGDNISYLFSGPQRIESVTLIVDSALDRNVTMSFHQKDEQLHSPPGVMPETLDLDGLVNGQWQRLAEITRNHQRLVRIPVNATIEGVRFTLRATWGAPESRVYAFYFD